MDLSKLELLSIFLYLFFLTTLASPTLIGNETDRISLLELKANVIDPLGVLNTWNISSHFCEWPGIKCGRRHQRVTALFLNSSRLGGHLSPFIGNLSFLRRLHLENNTFSHQIPQEIGRLHRLRFMSLSNNSFNGTIPSNLSHCFSLRIIDLYGNKLVGKIPPETGLLKNIIILYLGINNLHGEIPSSIANLSNTLEMFHVENNHLSGRIPSSLARLKMIELLAFGGNNFSGTIPSSIYNLSSIKILGVQTNELHGELPSHLGQLLLPKLELFFFHTNQFSGRVPDISNASNLVKFEVMSNRLTGKVPKFTNCPNVNSLQISENNLGSNEGDDLDWLASLVNSTDLEVLSFDRNNFGGKLPEYIGNLSTKLWAISCAKNQIKGGIPAEIGNLVNLEVLAFGYNQMTGGIPSSLGKLQKLYMLYLHNNNLSGKIPSFFGNFTSLNILNLASNNFQGDLPSSLGKCKNLAVLSLFGNNLRGPIKNEVVSLSSLSRNLDLSSNHFTGSIPNEVGQLVNLNRLDISDNKLSGEIPESLGKCTVLMYLFLRRNSLQGTIPKSVGNLRGLVEIDFSHNNLSGKFPTYLENFGSLQVVNFSFNNLEGEIPKKGIFTNASAISVVGNPRLCGGIARLKLPKCPSMPNKNRKQSSKLIVSVVCGVVVILLLALISALFVLARKRSSMPVSGSPFEVSFLKVSYGDLLKATDGFCAANRIGTGSFGSVYKANILAQNNSLLVAVKVLNLQVSRALKSFVSECKVLGSIKHRNIVKLITACSSIDFQGNNFNALVYEFMINGSLEEWLHPRNVQNSEQGRHLNLIQRVNIAIDVAMALDHLHNNSHGSIVHSDIKPSNILLDNDLIARVGDFGLARFLEDPSLLFSFDQSSFLGIRGSIGYIAPEYSICCEMSKSGDVYSYGILLLEMFTGKRPTNEIFKDSFNLHNFVKMSLPERLSQIVDSALLDQEVQVEERTDSIREESSEPNKDGALERQVRAMEIGMSNSLWNCLNSVLSIGVTCSEARPNERMNISDVLKELQLIKIVYTKDAILDRVPGRGIS